MSTPPGFYQTLIIYTEIFGKFYPAIYILLTCKTECLYTTVLVEIRWLLNLCIAYVVCDSESGLINAIKSVFTDTKIHGFLFHLSHSIWRNVQESNLAISYYHKYCY